MTDDKSTFHLVRRGKRSIPLEIIQRKNVVTAEGRLAGTPLSRTIPVLLMFFGLVTLGEASTLLVSGKVGVAIHAATLILTITHAALVRRLNPTLSRLLVALPSVPLIRIVSLTSPLAEFSYIQWFTILAVILYAGIVTSIKILKPSLKSLGLQLPAAKHIPLEIGIILAGFGFGWLEYHILEPGALVNHLTLREIAAPILVLYVSTGLLEELLFRGLLQRYAGEALGVWPGILFVTLLFGVLHTGWASWWDILFVTAVGGIYAIHVRKTKSILGVSISHGITNAVLFIVMPLAAA